jgi:glycosyltransferase involved in cell wall biosynthesis
LKVLHLANYFFPEYSGTTTRFYNIVSRLPFEVQLITSDRVVKGKVISPKQEQFGNISVNRLPLGFGFTAGKNSAWGTINAIRRDTAMLAGFARQQQFDIIHAHNSVVFGQAAGKIAVKPDRPFILEFHGLAQESLSGLFRGLKTFYIEHTDKGLMRRCDHIITLTNRLKEWIVSAYRIPEDKITVVPNGADTQRFAPGKEYETKANALKNGLGIGGKVVMYAGVMDKINGLDDLARVIPEMIRLNPTLCFLFLGGPAGNANLAALCSSYPENVKFLASVPYDDMPPYYEMCDIFVIPRPSTISSETIIPLKLLEAMAMGKPVAGSDVGGLAEVIKNRENGYLFEKGNLDSLKKTLLEALETDNTRIGRNARQTITEKYTWDKSVNTLTKVYEKLAG